MKLYTDKQIPNSEKRLVMNISKYQGILEDLMRYGGDGVTIPASDVVNALEEILEVSDDG